MHKRLFDGLKALSEKMEGTNSTPHRPTEPILKTATQNSEQPAQQGPQEHPFSPEEVKEALGYDRDDPNVEVIFERAENIFEALFGSITAAVTADDEDEHLDSVVDEVVEEVRRAVALHGPMHSPHEGYAVIKEEVDELWEAIKTNEGRGYAARKEAVQVAAMAIRYLLDVDPE